MSKVKKETIPKNASRLGVRSLKSPSSLDAENRSAEFIAATENPVAVFDWDSWGNINEVLLMGACQLPKGGAVPLLDTHSRHSVSNQLGSFRDMRIDGTELIGRAYFASVKGAEDAFTLVQEGHLTDVSVGYEVLEYRTLRENEVFEHDGKEYVGPLRLVTAWRLVELSLCPVGADENAKVRGKTMAKPNKRADDGANTNSDADDELKKTDARANEAGTKDENTDDTLPDDTDENDSRDAGTSDDPEKDDDDDDDDDNDAAVKPNSDTDGDDEGKRSFTKSERNSIAKKERQRCMQISAMCRSFGLADNFAENAISKGHGLDTVRTNILSNLQGKDMAGFKVDMGRSESEKVREVATQALGLRSGLSETAVAGKDGKLAGDVNHYRSMTLRELCRDMLVRSGQSIPSDVRDIVGRALTTTDLPAILSDSINRVLLSAWGEYKGTWEAWCGVGEVPDFRPQTLVSAGLGQMLNLIKEGGEYELMQMAEHAETVQPYTYGGKIAITRQAIINDDLSMLSTLPRLQAQAAARTINKLAYDVLTKNPLMGDNKALFHANHKNLITGAGGLPNVDKIGKLVTQMKQQQDVAGNPIGIQPRFFIAPTALETAAETFFTSQMIGSQEQPNQNNIYAGTKFVRVYDALLDVESESSWYVAGNKGDSVNLYFLNGNSAPRLEQKENWNTDGVELKVSIDAAAKAVSWQAIAKSQA